MTSQHVTGFSTESASAALSSALGSGLSAGTGSASVQIMVLGVHKTGNGWTASAMILTEPKLDLKPKKNNDTRQSRHDLEEQKRIEKERIKLKFEHDFELQRHSQEVIHDMHVEEQKVVSNLYMELIFEMVYQPIAENFDIDYVHFISEGSLWDEVLEHHPHLEMYEAAHDIPKHEDGTEPTAPENRNEFKLIPKLHYSRKKEDAA